MSFGTLNRTLRHLAVGAVVLLFLWLFWPQHLPTSGSDLLTVLLLTALALCVGLITNAAADWAEDVASAFNRVCRRFTKPRGREINPALIAARIGFCGKPYRETVALQHEAMACLEARAKRDDLPGPFYREESFDILREDPHGAVITVFMTAAPRHHTERWARIWSTYQVCKSLAFVCLFAAVGIAFGGLPAPKANQVEAASLVRPLAPSEEVAGTEAASLASVGVVDAVAAVGDATDEPGFLYATFEQWLKGVDVETVNIEISSSPPVTSPATIAEPLDLPMLRHRVWGAATMLVLGYLLARFAGINRLLADRYTYREAMLNKYDHWEVASSSPAGGCDQEAVVGGLGWNAADLARAHRVLTDSITVISGRAASSDTQARPSSRMRK